MACSLDESRGADDDRTNGGAQTFAEAQTHAIEAGAVVFQRPCARSDGFPQPRSIEVEFNCGALGTCPVRYGLCFGKWEDGTIEGIFEGDECGGCVMDIIV